MNNFKSLVSIFMLLVFLATRNTIAYALPPSSSDAGVEDEYEEGDYALVRAGEEAPYDGFLFDSDGMIKLITNKNFQLEKLKLEKDLQIQKLSIDLEYTKKQHILEIKAKEDIFNNVIEIKNKRIEQLEDSKKWDDVKLFSSMLLGMALSVTIFYAAVKITK